MPRPKFIQTFNGQSIYKEDLAVLADAAGAGDDALKHVVRNTGRIGRARVQRGLVRLEDGALITNGPTGIKNRTFTAWIGAETTDSPEGWSGLRSVTVPAEAFTFAVPALAGGRRIDLIVAKYSPRLTSGEVQRKVKNPVTGAVTEEDVSVTEYDAVTFEYLQGPAGSLPAWPSDPVGGFYIPIAAIYVTDGWSGAGTFPSIFIEEIADVRSSAISPRPPTSSSSIVGGVFGGGRNVNFASGSFGYINSTSMPSTMRGDVQLWIPVSKGALVTGKLIDDSVDWRNRLFRSDVEYRNGTFLPLFPWEQDYAQLAQGKMYAGFETGAPYDTGLLIQTHHGQSFRKVGSIVSERYALVIDHGASASTATYLYVDDNGALRLTVGQTASRCVLVWLQASAQYTFPGYV